MYGAGFYGPLFFLLETEKKIQLHVLFLVDKCYFCMKNGSESHAIFLS